MSQVQCCEDIDLPAPEKVGAKITDGNHGDSSESGAVSAESDLDAGTRSNDDTDNVSLETSDSNSPRGSSDSAGYANGVSSVGSTGDSIDDSVGSEKQCGLKPYMTTTSGIGTGSESPSDHNRSLGSHSLHKTQHLVESTGTSSSSTDWEYTAMPVHYEQEAVHSNKEETDSQATTNFQQFHKVIESAGKRKHIRRKPARPHQSRPLAPDEMSSSSSTTAAESIFLEPQPQTSQQSNAKSLTSMYGSIHNKRSLDESTEMLDPCTTDMKPCNDGDKALKRRRFHRTFEALKECGLLDLTLQTAALIEQNKNLQQQLDALKSETQILYGSLKQMDMSSFNTGVLGQMIQAGQMAQIGHGSQVSQDVQVGQWVQANQVQVGQGVQANQEVQVSQGVQANQVFQVGLGPQANQEVQVGEGHQASLGAQGNQGVLASHSGPSQALLNTFPFQHFIYNSFSLNQQLFSPGQMMPSAITSQPNVSQTVLFAGNEFKSDIGQNDKQNKQQLNQILEQQLQQQQQPQGQQQQNQQQKNRQQQGEKKEKTHSDSVIYKEKR